MFRVMRPRHCETAQVVRKTGQIHSELTVDGTLVSWIGFDAENDSF